MQKISTHKAFAFFTLLFVLIAVASFAAFETEQVCTQAQACLKTAPAPKGTEMLWELLSRQILSVLTI